MSTLLPNATLLPFPGPGVPVSSRTAYLSSTITSLVACITPMIALMYLVVLSWVYRYSQRNPKPLNKASGVWLQRYAPWVYIFIVFSSLAEVSVASWLALQYRFHHNYPNLQTRNGTRFLLFSSCWTTATAAVYTLLFLHPVWSKHPVASIGAQAIWIIVTWIFWIVGAALINTGVPSLLVKGRCVGMVYCAQLSSLFGLAVVESLTLTAGMATMIWLAWQSTRSIVRPMELPLR